MKVVIQHVKIEKTIILTQKGFGMFNKLKKWFSQENEEKLSPGSDYIDPITKAAIESGFNSDTSMQKDTEVLERVLILRHGLWLFPHRCTSLSGGRDNLLRYRKWLPPVIITPAETTNTDPRKEPIVFNVKDRIQFPGIEQSLQDRGMNASFNKEHDLFVNPVALDVLLTRIIPITDPRYYRIFKEVAFDLCHKLADKTRQLFSRGQNGEFFPDYPLELDSFGNVKTETFEEIFSRRPFKSPQEFFLKQHRRDLF